MSRPRYLELFAVAFAALLLEIGYTRVFSFKISSAFTYLILGFALLGMGAGAIFVELLEPLRRATRDGLLARLSLAGGAAIAAGYAVVVGVELSTHEPPTHLLPVLRLALVCAALFAGFLAAGMMIAVLLTREQAPLPRLYLADLAGAACGCAAAVPLMLLLSPPGCVLASAAALTACGVRSARRVSRGLAAAGVSLALLLALTALFAHRLPDPVVDPEKTMGRENRARWSFSTEFTRWSPVFRVDVLESPLGSDMKLLVHDGMVGSGLWPFDGDLASVAPRFEPSNRRLAFALTRPDPRVLIIGSAGGYEILASLYFGASNVTAVELNPVTVSLLREHFADYTGRLAENPKVELVNAEGRSFLHGDPGVYDLIYFVAPDSFAAMNAAQTSGFVLVESYLYTTEAIREAVRHLAPGGVLCAQFGEVTYATAPNRTARYLATARQAFAELGIRDFGRHVLMATNEDYPVLLTTVLLRREPFDDAEVERFMDATGAVNGGVARHAFGRARDLTMAGRVILAPEERLPATFRLYGWDVTPVTDDGPFFWHFARYRDLLRNVDALRNAVDHTRGMGELALVVMLGVATLFAAAALSLPFLAIRERWRRLPGKGRSVLYFGTLGLGFMFFEIALIQRLTLVLGYPTYTLSVTLFALLVFTGLGSLASERYAGAPGRAAALLAVAVAALACAYTFGLDAVKGPLLGAPLAVRIGLAVLAIAPLGLCLGAFLPLGLEAVAAATPLRREAIAWAWAVNGLMSVVGSLLATLVSMSFGFRALLLVSAALYAVAALLLPGLYRLPTRRAS